VRRRGNEVGSPAQQGGDRHSGHGCWRQAHAAEQRRLLRQHEATCVNVLRVREENGEVSKDNGEVSSGTAQLSWEAGGDLLTREREEAAPSSAISTAMNSLNLTAHGNDWRRWRWGEEKRRSAATGHFIMRVEDDVATDGRQVEGWRRQVGPVSSSAPLTGGPHRNCFLTQK
jgi:hypothetical protein